MSRSALAKAANVSLRALLILLLIAAIYFFSVFGYVYYSADHDQSINNAPFDAIVVLGAAQYNGKPSPVYKSRLDHALLLFKIQAAPMIVVTGGSIGKDRLSEGSVGLSYLRKNHIPHNNILVETKGYSTYQSLLASKRFMKSRNLNRILIVTDGWHMGRAKSIAKYLGFEAYGSPLLQSKYSQRKAIKQMVKESAGICLGELIGYWRVDRLFNTPAR